MSEVNGCMQNLNWSVDWLIWLTSWLFNFQIWYIAYWKGSFISPVLFKDGFMSVNPVDQVGCCELDS